MKLLQLRSKQLLPISKEKAWDFLSDPSNLKFLTPNNLNFQIKSGAERTIYPGQIIQYTISPLLGYRIKWITEITHVREGEYFVDEQRFGPYVLWHHKHFLKAVVDGVVMEDLIDYKLPLGFLGKLAHSLFVKKQLAQIFKYREAKIKELFGYVDGFQNELHFNSI